MQRFIGAIVVAGCHAAPTEPTMPGAPTTIAVSAGSHLFSVEAEGFRRWEDRVEIQPGTRVTFHVR